MLAESLAGNQRNRPEQHQQEGAALEGERQKSGCVPLQLPFEAAHSRHDTQRDAASLPLGMPVTPGGYGRTGRGAR